MKKLLLLLSILVLFASCERTVYIDRPVDRPVPANKKIIDIKVTSSDWRYSNQSDNNFYFAEISVPEITKNVYDNGIVSMYIEYANSDGSMSLGAMPSVRHKEENKNGVWHQYTETIDFEYSVGKVVVYLTYSDFAISQPNDVYFLLKMMW